MVENPSTISHSCFCRCPDSCPNLFDFIGNRIIDYILEIEDRFTSILDEKKFSEDDNSNASVHLPLIKLLDLLTGNK